jgi:molecular chaperone HscA
MSFKLLQGEREEVKHCRTLAQFELTDIPPMRAGKARIEVCFAVDTDGILSVTARETVTARTSTVEVKPGYGLSPKDVNDALEDAFRNAQGDHESKLLRQSKIQAQTIITRLNDSLKETPEVLEGERLIKLRDAISALQNVINSDNREAIIAHTKDLNILAKDFIQKHLDYGAEKQLIGKRLEDIKV